MKIGMTSSIDQMRLLRGEIPCLPPLRSDCFFKNRLPLGYALNLFAEKIIKKYKQFDNYGFDPAVLVFLQNLYEKAEKHNELNTRVEQTLRLLILWNRQSEVKDQIICHHNVYLSSLKNEIELNLSYIKQLSLPQYNQLHKLYSSKTIKQNLIICRTMLESVANISHTPGGRELFYSSVRERLLHHLIEKKIGEHKQGLLNANIEEISRYNFVSQLESAVSTSVEMIPLFREKQVTNILNTVIPNAAVLNTTVGEKAKKPHFFISHLRDAAGTSVEVTTVFREKQIIRDINTVVGETKNPHLLISDLRDAVGASVVAPAVLREKQIIGDINTIAGKKTIRPHSLFSLITMFPAHSSRKEPIRPHSLTHSFSTILESVANISHMPGSRELFYSPVREQQTHHLIEKKTGDHKQNTLNANIEEVSRYNLVSQLKIGDHKQDIHANIEEISRYNLVSQLESAVSTSLKAFLLFREKQVTNISNTVIPNAAFLNTAVGKKAISPPSLIPHLRDAAGTSAGATTVFRENQIIRDINTIAGETKKSYLLISKLSDAAGTSAWATKVLREKQIIGDINTIAGKKTIRPHSLTRSFRTILESVANTSHTPGGRELFYSSVREQLIHQLIEKGIRDHKQKIGDHKQNVHNVNIGEVRKIGDYKQNILNANIEEVSRYNLVSQLKIGDHKQDIHANIEEVSRYDLISQLDSAVSTSVEMIPFFQEKLVPNISNAVIPNAAFLNTAVGKKAISPPSLIPHLRDAAGTSAGATTVFRENQIIRDINTIAGKTGKVGKETIRPHSLFSLITMFPTHSSRKEPIRPHSLTHSFRTILESVANISHTPGGRELFYSSHDKYRSGYEGQKLLHSPTVTGSLLRDKGFVHTWSAGDVTNGALKTPSPVYIQEPTPASMMAEQHVETAKHLHPAEYLRSRTAQDRPAMRDQTSYVRDALGLPGTVALRLGGDQPSYVRDAYAAGKSGIISGVTPGFPIMLKNVTNMTATRIKNQAIGKLRSAIRKTEPENLIRYRTDIANHVVNQVVMELHTPDKAQNEEQTIIDLPTPSQSTPSQRELINQFGNLISDPNLPSSELIGRQVGSLLTGFAPGVPAKSPSIPELVKKVTLGEQLLRQEQRKVTELTQKIKEQEAVIYKMNHAHSQLQEDVASRMNEKKIKSMVMKELRARMRLEKMRYGLQ